MTKKERKKKRKVGKCLLTNPITTHIFSPPPPPLSLFLPSSYLHCLVFSSITNLKKQSIFSALAVITSMTTSKKFHRSHTSPFTDSFVSENLSSIGRRQPFCSTDKQQTTSNSDQRFTHFLLPFSLRLIANESWVSWRMDGCIPDEDSFLSRQLLRESWPSDQKCSWNHTMTSYLKSRPRSVTLEKSHAFLCAVWIT